ncbi:hypothetical protein [Streptomyces sp. KR55]|uniref:hypothetical protein n=1 Tax=Streptomyces sp. KR55 TaxID=3457425 RepID=UPI003FCF6520
MSSSASPKLATFRLYRDHDVSGISGEGVVAEGVQFSDGWVVTHWLDRPPMNEPKTDVWHHKGTGPVTKIHGHGGSTRIVWTDDVAAARREGLAHIAEAYDVPTQLLGPEAERAYLHRQMAAALLDAWQARGTVVDHPEGHCATFADAVMPIVEAVLRDRDDAQAMVGRAHALASRWQAAHGASMFLVRAAGAELRDELDGETELTFAHLTVDLSNWERAFARVRRDPRADDPSYDLIEGDGTGRPIGLLATLQGSARPTASSCSNPDHACGTCGECAYEHEGEVCPDGAEPLAADHGPPNQGPLTGIEVRDPCPHCEGGPLIPRRQMIVHMREHHPGVVLDFPLGWRVARAVPLKEHNPKCNYAQTRGALLCDCHVLFPEQQSDDPASVTVRLDNSAATFTPRADPKTQNRGGCCDCPHEMEA